MRCRDISVYALAAALSVPVALGAQTAPPAAGQAAQSEANRKVEGGGISVPGGKGSIDASEEKKGEVLNNAKLAKEGNALHVTTGPAVTYWNPEQKASGNYTVKATFTEPKYMNLNTHPHPYGVFIGGNDMGTENQTELYCAAYGNGKSGNTCSARAVRWSSACFSACCSCGVCTRCTP